MSENHHAKRPYIKVFVALAVLTAVEVGVARLGGLPQLVFISLLATLAIAKALLVALFYMHLRYDHTILAIIGGFPFFLAVVMALVILADRTLAGGLVGG
ncbi:MAG TPA: cytochrome C oxidase subunit IV family protein [Anaerolineae bacterium]|jgi:cytochrome c oxidase subunit 4